MDKPHDDFYYSDGRIDPDKAFNFVRERVQTMSSEEFVRLMSNALEVRPENDDIPDKPVSKGSKTKTRSRTTSTALSPSQGASKRPSRAKKKADL